MPVVYLLLALIELALHEQLCIGALYQLIVGHADSSLLLLHLLLQGSLLCDQGILKLSQGSVLGVKCSLPVLPGFLRALLHQGKACSKSKVMDRALGMQWHESNT